MSEVRYYGPPGLTEAEIDERVAKTGGVLSSYGYGFRCPERGGPARVGGWEIVLCDTRGMGNHGSFIAVAADERTYDLQYTATVRLLRRWVDEAQREGTLGESGDFACAIIPLVRSSLHPDRGTLLVMDSQWEYHYYPHTNHVRVGDGRVRLWVRPQRVRPLRQRPLRGGLEPVGSR